MNSTTRHTTTATVVNNLANPTKRVKGSILLTGRDVAENTNLNQPSSASNCLINGGQVNYPSGCHCTSTCLTDVKKVADYFDSIPIGYRFKPTDEEIISHYLRKKIKNQSLPKSRIIEANVYENHPKDLAAAYPEAIEGAWYFFSSRDKKYRRGNRPSRSAGPGYWKATGLDKTIKENETTIGGRMSLAYYKGRQPNGTKTNWLMHEYVVVEGSDEKKFDDYVLCKIYKNGRKKEKDVASNDHDENLTADNKDRNDQADQNNVIAQYPNHQSMNNNIGQVMVPYQQAHSHMSSNQDVHPTLLQAENNHVVVQQASRNSNPTLHHTENVLPILGSSQHMVPDHHLPLSVQMMTSFQHNSATNTHIFNTLVGQSFATQLDHKYSYFPSTPQRSLYLPPQHGHMHPETYSCDPSSNPPSLKEAPTVLQGGNECDGRANLKRNIELMLAKDGYDWLNTDDDYEFQFDKVLEEQLEVDESNKHA